MFDIGFGQLLIVAIVALIVLGPQRLPKAARFAGLWVRRARAQWYSVKSELERELAAEELKRSLQDARDAVNEVERSTRDAREGMQREFDSIRDEVRDGADGRASAQAEQRAADATDAGSGPAVDNEGGADGADGEAKDDDGQRR